MKKILLPITIGGKLNSTSGGLKIWSHHTVNTLDQLRLSWFLGMRMLSIKELEKCIEGGHSNRKYEYEYIVNYLDEL